MGDKSYGKGFEEVMTEYNEKALFPQIAAVDFDGLLVENDFPAIGKIRQPMFDAVLRLQAQGWKIILWTCRTDRMLEDAYSFCVNNGLIPDAVNENIKEVQEYFGGDTRKVFANIYLDDRNAQYIPPAGFQVIPSEVYCCPI